MKLIKNSGSDRVIDVLRQATQSCVSVDIASPALSLFAFFELRDLLNQAAHSRLILPLNVDGDLTLLGSSADRAARNRLQARWLALECAKWINEKTEVRAPSSPLPQSAYLIRHLDTAESRVDAYDDTRISGRPKGQLNVNAPLPHALEEILAFIDDHTFHPRRVVGLNNVRLDEYPWAAIREVLLNAVAHCNYDDASRKVFVRLFSDRIEIASPGYPLKPLTLAKLRKGNYRPCSRNPLIAQALCTLDKMEQRGTGFARMRDAMLDHGLDAPMLDQQDGFFVVILPGSAGNYDRLRTPADPPGLITPAMEARLNERQKKMAAFLLGGEELTSRRCESEFGVTRDTATRDFALLLELGIAQKQGKGRSVRYVYVPDPNRQVIVR